jgi:peroxiredoxin
MIASRSALLGLLCSSTLVFASATTLAGGPQNVAEPAQPKPKVVVAGVAGSSAQAINEEYARQLLQIERQRLQRLMQLAASQPPKEAAETYEQLFRLAIAANLFTEVEPAAKVVLKDLQNAPPVIQFLARTIDIIASADRGAYEESIADLRSLNRSVSARTANGEAPAGALDTSALLAIFDAYYGRLIQVDQFDAAKSAFRFVIDESDNPAVKRYCASRLTQLDLIGKPAPAIEGTDLDGKKVSLAEHKGNVVLVVFWASWCMPCSAEVAWLNQAYSNYRSRGLRVIGVSVDTMQSDSPKLETLMPNIRRFVIDHNIRWPNLVNGQGATDYAKAYSVADIPANFLIGRDGNVSQLDVTSKNAELAIGRSVGR